MKQIVKMFDTGTAGEFDMTFERNLDRHKDKLKYCTDAMALGFASWALPHVTSALISALRIEFVSEGADPEDPHNKQYCEFKTKLQEALKALGVQGPERDDGWVVYPADETVGLRHGREPWPYCGERGAGCELAERPPCRVINGHLVYDAVGLVEPLVLTRALMDAVGAGLAQRAAAAVEQAAKPKRIKKHDAPQDRPNNFAGTTGAAAAAHLEKRDKQREDDRSADAQKKAKAQAKRDAKKAAEEAKLKENAVVALKVLIAHAGR